MLIDFDKIDQRKVSILCKHPESIQGLVQFLQSKKFDVHFEKVPGSFFQSINNLKPGFVMISHEMNDFMGKLFPLFIQKKFNIPVLLFHELQPKKENTSLKASTQSFSSIRSLSQNAPELIHREIERFRENYNENLQRFSNSKSPPSIKKLRDQRIQQQEDLMKQLDEKIQKGLPVLDNKEQLQLLSIKVTDPNGHGAFLFFTELPKGKVLSDFKKSLLLDLQLSENQEIILEPVEGEISQKIFRKLKNNSDRVLNGFWGDLPVSVLYYIDVKEASHQDEITVTENGYLVPVENWWSQVPLTFNAHIWFRENNKKILYIHRGDYFPQENLARFVVKHQQFLINGNDFHAFQQMSEIASLAGL